MNDSVENLTNHLKTTKTTATEKRIEWFLMIMFLSIFTHVIFMQKKYENISLGFFSLLHGACQNGNQKHINLRNRRNDFRGNKNGKLPKNNTLLANIVLVFSLNKEVDCSQF